MENDINIKEEEIDLWDIIPISTPSKKAKKEYMKSIMSTIVYNGVMFKDKLSESSNKTINPLSTQGIYLLLLYLENSLSEANAKYRIYLNTTQEINPVANLTTTICDILCKVDAIVSVKSRCTAPEHRTSIE